jgi:DNA adenine methylase
MEVKPFLKWAGGKGQLLQQFETLYPHDLSKIKVYVEPFIGGGAVFFDFIKKYHFEKIYLNDINEVLILTYKVIRDYPDELITILNQLETEYLALSPEEREIEFYQIRTEYNIEKHEIDYNDYSARWIHHAAHNLFLNKTCFNGLYRLNRKGEFNVPFGKYGNPTICNEENLRDVSDALKNVTLLCGDFEDLTQYIDENTFVYMDPPYRPLNTTSSFTSYHKDDFNDESQIRLSKWFAKLDKEKRALLMLSNSNPKNTNPEDDFFEKLYADYNIITVSASRHINSKASGRGAITELLIRNYD